MAADAKRPRGRPKGPETNVVNIRITRDLLERLDRYVDSELIWSHDHTINRATVMREALTAWLEGKGY
ncbi:hypothetical protein [Candidatus Entotheonella palauensis]|uniref:hypothetical protein n=1 Tax=Candidatus Entotheonella palauensis TaxID=93172 RepID=UPI000B7DD4E4|nr:hypothetical protein [Candidatus Entotheonella palauensis]